MSAVGDTVEVSFDEVAAFGTTEMEAALSSASKVRPEQNFVGAPQDKEEAESKAREHGYTAPVPYDYSAYGSRGQAAPNGGVNISAPVKVGFNATEAARYEWKDEYGDVGPKIPELEKYLFASEFRMDAGLGRNRLDGFHIEMKEHGTGDILSRDIYKVSSKLIWNDTLRLEIDIDTTDFGQFDLPIIARDFLQSISN